MGMASASDRMHGPIPRDPDVGECQVEHQMWMSTEWVQCGEYADEMVMDILMCENHIDDHYRSEQADRDRKREG